MNLHTHSLTQWPSDSPSHVLTMSHTNIQKMRLSCLFSLYAKAVALDECLCLMVSSSSETRIHSCFLSLDVKCVKANSEVVLFFLTWAVLKSQVCPHAKIGGNNLQFRHLTPPCNTATAFTSSSQRSRGQRPRRGSGMTAGMFSLPPPCWCVVCFNCMCLYKS